MIFFTFVNYLFKYKMIKTSKKMDAGLMNLTNKRIILKLIKQRTSRSRSEIARETGMTPPSVSRIVNELVNTDKLVEYVGVGNSSGGRPPVVVKFKNENNNIIGIDLGATYIRGCMVDLYGNFISEIQVPTEIEKGFNFIVEKVVQVINKLQSRKKDSDKIWGVGIGVAGLVNNKTGIIEFSPDFSWSHVNLHEVLKEKINLPFFYNNSTRLMALGELNFNNKKNLRNFAVINVGYGIAAGLVVEGDLVFGNIGFAGEFGHISVDTCSKVQCKCGLYGCLEAMASGHRIATLGLAEIKNGNDQLLSKYYKNNQNTITAELVAKAAQEGDAASIKIYNEVTDYLCKGIGILANLLNPESIYIGGGISLNGKFFFDLINSKISKYLLTPNLNLKILPATYGEQATSIGAVSLVLEKILNFELK
jgi:glucokinase-like ROK family protein